MANKSDRARAAFGLVNLLGPGPASDPARLEQARILLMAWSSSQSAVFGMLRELERIRDNPTYAEDRFERPW